MSFVLVQRNQKTLKEILERLLSQLCAVEKGIVNFSNWLYSSLKRIIDGAQSERTYQKNQEGETLGVISPDTKCTRFQREMGRVFN